MGPLKVFISGGILLANRSRDGLAGWLAARRRSLGGASGPEEENAGGDEGGPVGTLPSALKTMTSKQGEYWFLMTVDINELC